ILRDNFIFGVGLSNFENIYGIYQAEYFSNNSITKEILLADIVRYPYNEALKVICEQGIIGLVLVFILLYFLMVDVFRLIRKTTIFSFNGANLLVLITFSVLGMFSYPSDDISIKLVLLLSICFLLTSHTVKKANIALTT